MEEENKQVVPNLNLSEDKKVVRETKEIPLIVNGKEQKITLGKLSAGMRNQIRRECTKTSYTGNVPKIDINETEIQERMVYNSITEAPFKVTLETIKELPSEVVDYIFEEYMKFAEPSKKKQEE